MGERVEGIISKFKIYKTCILKARNALASK